MFAQLLSNGIFAGCVAALLAGAFTILYSGSRFFVFTFGASYTVAAYTLLGSKDAISVWGASFLGIAAAAILGVCFEYTIYRPVRRRGEQALVLMLSSIGLYLIVQNTISLIFGDTTQTIRSGAPSVSLEILGARVTSTQLKIASTSTALMIAMWGFLRYTKFGLRLRAVLADPDLARIIGLDVDRIVLLGAGLGSGLAGIASVLTSQDIDLVPTMGFDALLIGVVGAVVGGITTIRGATLGGFLVGLLQHIAVWKLPTQWQQGILFVLLVGMLLLRPQGLFGRTERSEGD